MAGGHWNYRHLSRSSKHRQALLRNLVTALFTHESIRTTWHKAKEAQRLAEKVVTLAKRNTPVARRRAQAIFFTPHDMIPKIFTEIRMRYANRPGGYTRVLRTEPHKEDQAVSAILELVDGPLDTRYALTAKTVAKNQIDEEELSEITALNVKKVTQFRENGEVEFEALVRKMKEHVIRDRKYESVEPKKQLVYPDHSQEWNWFSDRHQGKALPRRKGKVVGRKAYPR